MSCRGRTIEVLAGCFFVLLSLCMPAAAAVSATPSPDPLPRRPFLGVSAEPAPNNHVRIGRIVPNSSAARSELAVGDILLTLNGAPVESVGTFLRRIGAAGALLELEARQVSRALRGELNRVLNAESANLQRAVAAAGRQLDAIAVLDADGRLQEQPFVVRTVADARRETPEATLSELAERLDLHRSAVQRALERLERLAEAEPAPPAGVAG